MKNVIFSYALIMSFQDGGTDYVDSFLPFVLAAINGSANMKEIQSVLKQRYGIDMPSHVVANVLNRAKQKDYVTSNKRFFELTSEGTDYIAHMESEAEVERRLNALISDIVAFFRENGTAAREDTVADLLSGFVSKNLEPLVECINPDIEFGLYVRASGRHSALLARYIQDAERHKPDHFRTIQDIVYGSIISVVLYTRRAADLERLMNRFKHCQAFLDANYVFSVLGLHPDEFNEPAKELFNLLKRGGFTIKVFDFTLDEMSQVLSRYLEEEHRYPKTVSIDSVYSWLKRRGWTKRRVIELITNLEGVLAEQGISVEWGTGVDVNAFEPQENGELRSLLARYKPEYSLRTQNHDLAAIEKIKQYRGHPVRQIQHCKALFLTSDNNLSRFNYIEMGHKENRTVSEVIPDRLLTNILWLRNPSSNLPIKSILAAHSRRLFIQRKVWERFYGILKELRQQGRVQDENISMLFYHGFIEDALNQFEHSDADQITEEFALATIERAAESLEEETARVARQQEQQFLDQLGKAVSKSEVQKDREWTKRIQESKASIRAHTERSVGKRLIGAKLAVLAGLCTPFVVHLASGDWSVFWRTASIVTLALGVLQFFLPRPWDSIRERWLNRSYTSRLQEAKLDTLRSEDVSSP